ncbi:hypothetical protein F0562_007918 [Nyssa sinensis]|uniref:PGG domain-containing protein n=1 Tax=Nyssa sinensis TaxID=561372 RepID=A0A5J5A810_9ASTE|nr:hypothetical protein F0562_007918 [Nyssa sinensis]
MDDRLRQAIYGLHAWITQADDRMDENLRQAIDTLRASITAADDNGNIDALYASIRVNPKLLESIDQIPFLETPLHIAAAAAGQFLCACPESIEDLTVRGETAVHIAVANGGSKPFEILLGWLHWTDKEDVRNWEDGARNTLLHIAASNNQPQARYLSLTFV